MSEPINIEEGEMVVATITVTKVLMPDGRFVVRYDTHDDQATPFIDLMAMLEFAKAILTEKAMRGDSDD